MTFGRVCVGKTIPILEFGFGFWIKTVTAYISKAKKQLAGRPLANRSGRCVMGDGYAELAVFANGVND
jgi:hypothetical protein